MPGYDTGGGGGISGAADAGSRSIYSKPYELTGEPTAEMVQQVNLMLEELYRAANQVDDVGVTGPSSSVDGNVAVWDGTTGKAIRDGGSSNLIIATLDLSAAQIRVATSYTIVAAPGAGKLLIPIQFTASREVTSAFSAAGAGADLQYAGSGSNIVNFSTLALTTVGVRLDSEGVASVAQTSDRSNEALVVDINSALTGGALRNDICRFSVCYYIVNTPHYPPTTN